MYRKGFVQVLPLIAAMVVILGGFSLLASRRSYDQKTAVGKVLSDESGGGDRGGDSSSGGRGSSGGGDHNTSSSSNNSGSSNSSSTNNQKSGSSRENKEPPKASVKNNFVTLPPLATPAVENNEEERKKPEVKIEKNKEKTKIETENFKIEIEREGDKFVTKIKSASGEAELEHEQENEIVEAAENELRGRGIRIATDEAKLGFIQDGRRVESEFPLSINSTTGALTVKTPAGEKEVAVLPGQAIDNIIKAGVITRTVGTSTNTSGVSLTMSNNQAVFKVEGIKTKRLLGILPTTLNLEALVSAQSGQLLSVNQDLVTKILDLLSF